MTIKTNPDIVRKHSRYPRTMREATGNYSWDTKPSTTALTWAWRIVMAAAALVIMTQWWTP